MCLAVWHCRLHVRDNLSQAREREKERIREREWAVSGARQIYTLYIT